NERIEDKLPLFEKREISMDQALSDGAIALFGEKYGDSVRTIRFGESIELCGGTHVGNTSEIWGFKILSEGGVASGVRRVEAITGKALKKFYKEQFEFVEELKSLLKNKQNPLKEVAQLQEENKRLKKQIEELEHEKAGQVKKELKSEIREENGVHFLAKKVDMDASGMKDL